MTTRFPVSDYYSSNVLDGYTVARSGGWWTAILLIRSPRNGSPFIGLYRWQKDKDSWKTRSSFKIRDVDQVKDIREIIDQYSERL